jgi:hypothetical protein
MWPFNKKREKQGTHIVEKSAGASPFNKTDFVQEWINQDEYYRIGYDKTSKQKVIAVTITWICWYEIYFNLTYEEFDWHRTQVERLNDLAQRLAVDKGHNYYKNRLLLYEGPT